VAARARVEWLSPGKELGTIPRDSGVPLRQSDGVQILIDCNQAADGRLSGTATRAGDDRVLPFSGNLELLARVEELSRVDRATREQGENNV
jgi:hypothetical protein